MQLTHEQLDNCLPNASDIALDTFLPWFNRYFNDYEITTKKRATAFLAQIAHESGSLRYVEEIASGSNYEFREDLGNLEFEALQAAHAVGSTTGKYYKGRGLIQVTGYYNYKKCGEALGIDLVHNPKLLSSPEYAVRSAMWFWQTHGCNELADQDCFNRITKRINGGLNGIEDRMGHWERIKRVLR